MRRFLGIAVSHSNLKKETEIPLDIDFFNTDTYTRDILKTAIVV